MSARLEVETAPPMIIDSFAGGGGASTGIENALGRAPDVAINHSADALALHAANHPETLHLDSNIWDVDPREVADGRHVGLLWASPDCKHFSKAKGAAPRDRNIRDLAWVVVKWAEDVKPDVICMENVEEFVTWGPLDNDGKPIKEFAGATFDLWVKRLRRAGYRVDWRELRACDYGAPTIRKRWFLVARRDKRRIFWPKPTHGDPKSPAVRKGKLKPWRTAAECIDWSIPCPSIFATSTEIMADFGIRAIRPLAANTLARVARGMKRYVIDAKEPFIVNLTHGARAEPGAEPFRTITGANRGEKAVIVPAIVGAGRAKADACLASAFLASLKGTTRRDRSIGHPHPTVLAGGGHSAIIVPSLQRFNGGATGSDPRDPAPTVTANSWIKKPGGAAPLGVLSPYLASIAHGDSGGRREYPLGDPLGTVTVGGIQHALIAPVLTYAQQGGHNRPADTPHHTICASTKDQNSVLVAGLVQTGYGERPDQHPRALDVQAPLGTVVAGGAKHAPFAAFLAQQNGGPRNDALAGRAATAPASTVTGSGSQQTPVAAFVARQFGASTGHAATAPNGTITAGGQGKSQPVAAFFARYYGTGDGARHADPAHTVTTKDRFAHSEAQLAAPPFGPEHEDRARQVADFLRAHGAWEGDELVTLQIDGESFVVVDIGLRMLTPRELFNAQGFPRDYVIEGVWQGLDTDTPLFRAFPKNVQVSCCGNSVCPPLAEALVRANCAHLAVEIPAKQEASAQ
ncbi:DNA cytosine methyltransferase [Rhodobacter sp. NTK016B]|uniref:DNA cytosine methyltransferase n=1 Tax=Rhodobacter sp. NTK016B TaxID=2759676 RepID=UPI001A9066AD|nr:DNA cytosine methyltransferase [Rhodobacter sp. NTK016B]MBN8294583.1 DNA cytosine methyltransferase [Rhodobacter sp. NTK016B]